MNEAAEMRWHLERARIIAAIENEMSAEARRAHKLSYVTSVNGKYFLQVDNDMYVGVSPVGEGEGW